MLGKFPSNKSFAKPPTITPRAASLIKQTIKHRAGIYYQSRGIANSFNAFSPGHDEF
jgi:hypothetical protein